MQLHVVRPLQRHPAADPPPPGAVNILLLATEALERKHMIKISTTAPWHWLFTGYVDWHSLATLLAELCAPQDDRQLVARAWQAADIAFAAVEERVAEGTSGMLWKPLKKLMRLARRRRALDEPGGDLPLGQSWLPESFANVSMQPSSGSGGLDTLMNVADTSLPTDFGFGLDPLDDSWMNWQGFVDDLAQNSFIGWSTSLAPFHQQDSGSGGWPSMQ